MAETDSLIDGAPDPAAVGLTFRPMEQSEPDLDLFGRCFKANGSARTPERLRWQYFSPPSGKLYVDLALEKAGSVAAIYATFPVAMKVGSERRLCVQSIDTLTDARHRGRGLFVRMANALYERCRIDGVDLVYGFPNGNSAHGFFERLDWTSLDPVPFVVRPLSLGYLLSRVGLRGSVFAKLGRVDLPLPIRPTLQGAFALRRVSSIGPEFDRVWSAFAAHVGVAVERNAEYLRWRLARPDRRYDVVGLYDGDHLLGYVITALHAGAPVTASLMDLVYDPAAPNAGRVLLADALHRLRAEGCEAAWGWNFRHAPNHGVLRRAGFLPVPSRFLSLELHAGVRVLGGSDRRALDRGSWYMSLLDSDTD